MDTVERHAVGGRVRGLGERSVQSRCDSSITPVQSNVASTIGEAPAPCKTTPRNQSGSSTPTDRLDPAAAKEWPLGGVGVDLERGEVEGGAWRGARNVELRQEGV